MSAKKTEAAESSPANTGKRDDQVLAFVPSQLIELEAIARNPKQPRRDFDAAKLQLLAESIQLDGQLQPIAVHRTDLVDPDDCTRACRYMIILGERRWRAMRALGRTHIEAKVYEGVDAATVAARALVENLQREALNVLEEADGYAELEKLGMKQEDIAARVNRSRSAVANALRLLNLPEPVQLNIRAGKLTAAHGMTLLRFAAWPKVCSEIARRALQNEDPAGELEREGLPYYWDLENSRPRLIAPLSGEEHELVRSHFGSMPKALEALPWLFEERYRHCASRFWSMDPEKSGSWLAERKKEREAERAKQIEQAKAAAEKAKKAGKPVPKKAAAVLEQAKTTRPGVNPETGRQPMSEAEKKERKRKIDANRRRRDEAKQALDAALQAIAKFPCLRSEDVGQVFGYVVLERASTSAAKDAAARLGIEWQALEKLSPLQLIQIMLAVRVIELGENAIKYAGSVPGIVATYAKQARPAKAAKPAKGKAAK